jgi:citrate lyase beta subunit
MRSLLFGRMFDRPHLSAAERLIARGAAFVTQAGIGKHNE